jgi:hypothetical protein
VVVEVIDVGGVIRSEELEEAGAMAAWFGASGATLVRGQCLDPANKA